MVSNFSKLASLPRHLTSQMSSRIKTFVFLDLETTGLPHLEHNKTKITELCAVAVQADHIELGCFPRVHNKLSFCFNPQKMIQPDSTDITGLSNELLEHQASFGLEIVEVLARWLEASRKPVCFVAHNGDRFDYPILQAEVENAGGRLPGHLLCVDSLTAFRAIDRREAEPQPVEFDDGFDELLCRACDEAERLTPAEVQKVNETTPKKQIISVETRVSCGAVRKQAKKSLKKSFTSYKLRDVYTRLTNKEALTAHQAESDVVMLITCAAILGEKFVAYANENSRCFNEIPAMKPGRRLGT